MRKSFPASCLAFVLALVLLLSGCAQELPKPAGSEPPSESVPSAEAGSVIISELMAKNKAMLRDADGDFSDWIELQNTTDADIDLTGWIISDKGKGSGMEFPAVVLPAGGYALVFASGKNRPAELHAPFKLSAGETVTLFDASGAVVSSASCGDDPEQDVSLALAEDGTYNECLYPTPGGANTTASYDAWQRVFVMDSPLLINEVMVADPDGRFPDHNGSDWVELKNVSDETLDLSGWYLSDNIDDPLKIPLSGTIAPDEILLLLCDDLGLSLNSSHDQLYLVDKASGLKDYMALRDIPYNGSYGRMPGTNGTFYFADPTPGEQNKDGQRRVSAMPKALTPDGVYNGVSSVEVALQANGARLYYTTDCSLPTEESDRWPGSVTLSSTGVVRVIAVEENALPSRPLTLSYIINEDHSLPVLSLVADDPYAFMIMYNAGSKFREEIGSLSFYEENGSFTIPCEIKMHGETSLILPKKNLTVRFRGAYGQESLEYDIFGGGVTNFTNLVLRAGQDFSSAIIRNELCENLALQASDNILTMRNRYCVLYMNGRYNGIYALSEKMNEQHYASAAGVSKNSVTVLEAPADANSDLTRDVFLFCKDNDMSLPENYETFLSRMDVDSLIDWVLLEGYFANKDLTYGNLRFCRSSENDGRWRFMLYDLDAAFGSVYNIHAILLHRNYAQSTQVSNLFADLWANDSFRDRFLRRANELLTGPLTNDALIAEIDRLAAEIDTEVIRDYGRYPVYSYESWIGNIRWLKNLLLSNDWAKANVDAICRELRLDDATRAAYFPTFPG